MNDVRKDARRVLVLGSGALTIAQAGEFDYSGTQAIKALKEEGIFVVLLNPNIATTQTNPGLADRIYLYATTPEIVEQIIVKEGINSLLLAFGGQTALNCGLQLFDRGILQKHGVEVLGTPISVIRTTEDRKLFVEALAEIGVHTAQSAACENLHDAKVAAAELGYPVMVRSAYALGGKGSGIVDDEIQLHKVVQAAFASGVPQVLVEECLRGWKEIEYEVVRDSFDNCTTICNMENVDSMGIHTGESIVVSPSQTLCDEEYQLLRSVAIRTIRHLGVVGECNIQYALDPKSSSYRVIEVNARLSRSSALASKATGYPLAYVAAKLALGYGLHELQNTVTGKTSAFFEPALDYIVCKMPRWDLTKFHGAIKYIGSEMKSVGEVMSIGRSFPEVLQKAIRMLDSGPDGFDPDAYEFENLEPELEFATPRRVFAIATALYAGLDVARIAELTRIDPWFIQQMAEIVQGQKSLEQATWPLQRADLLAAKKLGFSDSRIGSLMNVSAETVRESRLANGVSPQLAQIDTLAGEFPAQTNYLYLTYGATASDVGRMPEKSLMVLGSGVYRIGSSVEFDWCCVSALEAALAAGYATMMLNCNPETVSTDFDVCDRLVFDEVTYEAVLDIWHLQGPANLLISMGGQAPNNLATRLSEAGIPVLGTSARNIDRAEDRSKFSKLLDELCVDQPRWTHIVDPADATRVVAVLGGFPVLVRPSYVLSGAAMSVAHDENELVKILGWAKRVSPKHPVVVSQFELHAREIEFDGVAADGSVLLSAISEHIEDAGVHSGDATLVLPPQRTYLETIRRVRDIGERVVSALNITGPFNIQFLAKENSVKVIECNVRASRSFPFVSKVVGTNFAAHATRTMLGERQDIVVDSLNLDYVGVKVAMFSFSRLAGVDPLTGVEMASTGEVGCIGYDVDEALFHGLLATGFNRPKKGVLLSLGPRAYKYTFIDEARAIVEILRLPVFATAATAQILAEEGVACQAVSKYDDDDNSACHLIDRGVVDLVINIPREYDKHGRPDGYQIRRRAVDTGIGLVTDLKLAKAIVRALTCFDDRSGQIVAWNDYVKPDRDSAPKRSSVPATPRSGKVTV
jgi:carbamoyl-phosphate synthase large subunit